MPNIEFNGLVTREIKYGENSRVLTVLAKDLGKVSILASRARSSRSGMLSSTQLFAYSDFTVFKGRDGGLLKINEGSAIKTFADIRTSLDKMAYASYFCDIVNHICQEGEEENEILRLLLNSMYMLEKGVDPLRVEAVFLFRILTEAGFGLSCSGCARCGRDSDIRFIIPGDGIILCSACADGRGFEINDTIYKAIRYISEAESGKVFSFTLGEKSMRYLAGLGEECMSIQLEKDLKTLNYLRQVRSL